MLVGDCMVSGGTVRGDLSSLTSYLKTCSSTISETAGGWKGASADSITTKVEEFVSEATGLLSGEMESFASACDLYLEYEEVKKELASLRSQLSSTKNDDEHKSKRSSLNSSISTQETKLAELKAKIESALSSVSGKMEASSNTATAVDAVSGAAPTTADWMTMNHKFGTLSVENFVSSDGTKIEYLLYKPDYGKEVSGLPTHMYMTGAGMKSTGDHIMTDGGVGKLLKEQNLNPSGYVIVPYVPSGHEYESEKYRKALAELPVAVAKEHNGDTNRISLSGHSYGAITAYRMVNENPNTFSAIVPVSGSVQPTESFKNVKVWAFHGAQDNPGNNTDYRKAVKNVQAIQAMGGTATLHSYTEYPNCYHTHTGNYTFANSFEDPDEDKKENISPLEWAFQQTKEESA